MISFQTLTRWAYDAFGKRGVRYVFAKFQHGPALVSVAIQIEASDVTVSEIRVRIAARLVELGYEVASGYSTALPTGSTAGIYGPAGWRRA